MRKRISSLCSLAMLFLLVGMVSLGQLDAQQSPTDHGGAAQQGQTQQSPDQSAQPAPDPQSQSPQAQSQASDSQTFSGTIVKSGSKYVLQDSASGNTYDIDRQDLAKDHEGQKVRISGTLDPNGKLIHVK
jgi:uncharacterized protein YdeI (BOF family)